MNKKDFLNEIGREKDYEVEECSVCLEEPTNPVSTRCQYPSINPAMFSVGSAYTAASNYTKDVQCVIEKSKTKRK